MYIYTYARLYNSFLCGDICTVFSPPGRQLQMQNVFYEEKVFYEDFWKFLKKLFLKPSFSFLCTDLPICSSCLVLSIDCKRPFMPQVCCSEGDSKAIDCEGESFDVRARLVLAS